MAFAAQPDDVDTSILPIVLDLDDVVPMVKLATAYEANSLWVLRVAAEIFVEIAPHNRATPGIGVSSDLDRSEKLQEP